MSRLALVGLCLFPAPALTQGVDTLIVESSPTCPDCRVHLDSVTTLGTRFPLGNFHPRVLVARGDEYLLVDPIEAHTIRVLGPSGELRRSVGREGLGPEEFVAIAAAFLDPTDSLHLLDVSSARYTVIGPDDSFARSTPVEIGQPFAIGGIIGGRLLVNADLPTREALGMPAHLLTREAQVGASFGAESPVYRPDAPYLVQRALAVQAGKAWLAHRTQYVLELWNAGPELKRVLVRDASWFRPYLRREVIGPEDPPEPFLLDVELRGDTLFSLISVADDDFSTTLRPLRETEARTIWDFSNCPALYDTVVEGILVESGRLLFSQRVDPCLRGFLNDGSLHGSRQQADGTPLIDIWSMTIRNFGQGGGL